MLSLFLIHYLCLLFSFISSSLSNKLPQTIINSPMSLLYLCPPFLKNNCAFYINYDFCFQKHLVLKYFKNNFKMSLKYFLIVIVLYILRISLCVTNLKILSKLISMTIMQIIISQLTRDHT